MEKEIIKLFEQSNIKVSNNYPQGATPKDLVVIKSKGATSGNNVLTHKFELYLYSRKDIDELSSKVYQILLKDILSVAGCGNPNISPNAYAELKDTKAKLAFIYSVDRIKWYV